MNNSLALRTVVTVVVLLCGAPAALGGEIIVTPQGQDGARDEAKIQKERARAYRKEKSSSATPTIIILPAEEEEGMLSPGRSTSNQATDNRLRAKEYRRSNSGNEGPSLLLPPNIDTPEIESSHDQARENRLRAKEYSRGHKPIETTVGADGIPLIVCNTDNIAGRIGDDNLSGNIITIYRNNKPLRVRCR